MARTNLIRLIKKAAVEAIQESKPVSYIHGSVVNVDPLRISIDQRLILEEDFLLLTDNVKNTEVKIRDIKTGEVKTIMIMNELQKGEDVLLAREQGGQNYIVMNRVVKP